MFFIEIISAYIATKVLVLGNTKISQAIDALFNNTISEYINKQFWIYVAVLVAAGFVFTYIQTYATKVFAVNMQTDFRREAGNMVSKLTRKHTEYNDEVNELAYDAINGIGVGQ